MIEKNSPGHTNGESAGETVKEVQPAKVKQGETLPPPQPANQVHHDQLDPPTWSFLLTNRSCRGQHYTQEVAMSAGNLSCWNYTVTKISHRSIN